MKYTGDGALPEVTDGMLQEALPAALPYTVVILKAGPNFSAPGPDRDQAVSEIVWKHGKRNFCASHGGTDADHMSGCRWQRSHRGRRL